MLIVVSVLDFVQRALDDFGVEYIELTSPAASPESRADCEAICKMGLKKSKWVPLIGRERRDATLELTALSLL